MYLRPPGEFGEGMYSGWMARSPISKRSNWRVLTRCISLMARETTNGAASGKSSDIRTFMRRVKRRKKKAIPRVVRVCRIDCLSSIIAILARQTLGHRKCTKPESCEDKEPRGESLCKGIDKAG